MSIPDCSFVSSFPWTVAVSGVVGIAGALLGALAQNRAAERRLGTEQQHSDRTRFHKERVEFYGTLLAAVQACRRAASDVQLLSPEERKEYGERGDYEPIKAAVMELNSANSAVQLIGSARVRAAAGQVVVDAVVLTVHASAEEDKFQAVNAQLSQSETAFAEASRDELLPKEEADRRA